MNRGIVFLDTKSVHTLASLSFLNLNLKNTGSPWQLHTSSGLLSPCPEQPSPNCAAQCCNTDNNDLISADEPSGPNSSSQITVRVPKEVQSTCSDNQHCRSQQ